METYNIYQRADRTLEAIRHGLSGLEFGVVGSYSKKVLQGDKGAHIFSSRSDIDIAVSPNLIPEVVNRLEIRISDSNLKIIPVNLYGSGGNPDKGKKIYQEYLVLTENLTPVHLIGSLLERQYRTATEILGIRYLESKKPTELVFN